MLTWEAQTYVRRVLASCEQLFGEPMPRREVHAPLEPGDHPKIDDSPLLDMEDIKKYWQMIGEMQWAVALGLDWHYCCYRDHGQIQASPLSRTLEAFEVWSSFSLQLQED
eukprot:4102003-Ditylum_brightwellii.AAC.1